MTPSLPSPTINPDPVFDYIFPELDEGWDNDLFDEIEPDEEFDTEDWYEYPEVEEEDDDETFI